MSKTFIRIYCNGDKVRSTGSEKWYRRQILDELFLDEKLNLRIPDEDITEKRINRLYAILTTYTLHTKRSDKYTFTVELVRSTSTDKRILKSVLLPWVHHSDGTFSLAPEYDIGKGDGYD